MSFNGPLPLSLTICTEDAASAAVLLAARMPSGAFAATPFPRDDEEPHPAIVSAGAASIAVKIIVVERRITSVNPYAVPGARQSFRGAYGRSMQ